MSDPLEFFATPGVMTSPGRQARLLDDLPRELESLCKIVQGLMIHIYWAEQYGVQLSDARREEVQLRSVERQLERIRELDPRPLTEAREPDKRLIGTCRDFSVLLTTMLRHQGVPARARCGFGRYFLPDHFEDHWVCEYWNAAEAYWNLVDAQLDALQVEKLGVRFDTLDVPRNEFVVAGRAWQMCRNEGANPDDFGIFDMHGLWFVRSNLVRDVAALNKVELLPWDVFGIMEAKEEDLSSDMLAALDGLAERTAGDVPAFDQVRALYETDVRWRVPATIRSYTPKGIITVELDL